MVFSLRVLWILVGFFLYLFLFGGGVGARNDTGEVVFVLQK